MSSRVGQGPSLLIHHSPALPEGPSLGKVRVLPTESRRSGDSDLHPGSCRESPNTEAQRTAKDDPTWDPGSKARAPGLGGLGQGLAPQLGRMMLAQLPEGCQLQEVVELGCGGVGVGKQAWHAGELRGRGSAFEGPQPSRLHLQPPPSCPSLWPLRPPTPQGPLLSHQQRQAGWSCSFFKHLALTCTPCPPPWHPSPPPSLGGAASTALPDPHRGGFCLVTMGTLLNLGGKSQAPNYAPTGNVIWPS